MCGLKQENYHNQASAKGHTLRGCVDWNFNRGIVAAFQICHTLRGCVDWNSQKLSWYEKEQRHTLRGCVDWNPRLINFIVDLIVTPFVGVWIETPNNWCKVKQRGVTPFVGVWIETRIASSLVDSQKVTPFVGVWIETVRPAYFCIVAVSHPSWVCGLKLAECSEASEKARSHPSWVCGLKLKINIGAYHINNVTPFVGVWIETNHKYRIPRADI